MLLKEFEIRIVCILVSVFKNHYINITKMERLTLLCIAILHLLQVNVDNLVNVGATGFQRLMKVKANILI